MTETQCHEEDLSEPPARHYAVNGSEIQQEPASNRLGKRLIGYLANLVCLVGAAYYLLVKQDVVMFLVLLGIATGQISISQAIKR